MSVRAKFLLFLATVLAVLISAYIWWVPALAEKFASRVPVSYEKSIGGRIYEQMLPAWEVDEERTQRMQDFYDLLAFDKVYHTKVTVVNSPEKNAFALPGGHIVVFSGILEDMPGWEALAALLAHETAHITERHTLRNIMRSMGRGMMISLFTGDGDGITAAVLSRVNELKGLEYSRELETEADNAGMRMMASRNIRPEGMLSLMEYLMEETKGNEPPALLSTHPVFEERIRNLEEKKGAYEDLGGNLNRRLEEKGEGILNYKF